MVRTICTISGLLACAALAAGCGASKDHSNRGAAAVTTATAAAATSAPAGFGGVNVRDAQTNAIAPATSSTTPGATTPGATTPGAAAPGGPAAWYVDGDPAKGFKANDRIEATVAADVLALVNAERQRAGLAALRLDPEAERAAKVHAEDMLARGYFAHLTPEGWDPGERLRRTGATPPWLAEAENIALGQPSAAECVQTWMSSPVHRANILAADMTHAGVGLTRVGPRFVMVFVRR